MKADLNAVDRIKEFNGEKFDSILAFDILEYLDSPYLFLKSSLIDDSRCKPCGDDDKSNVFGEVC